MALKQKVTKMEQSDFLFCKHILQEFTRPKHNRYVPFFKEPVDAAQVPSYRTVIKKPMDLSTIATKLENQEYSSAAAFKADFGLMFANSEKFNAGSPPSSVLQSGRMFSEAFEGEWLKQGTWLRKNHPSLIKDLLNDGEEALDEPPVKKLRQSSRLSASESSPIGQSPYTSASVFTKRSTSNPSTPVSTTSKKSTNPKAISSKAITPKPGSSQPTNQATTSQSIAPQIRQVFRHSSLNSANMTSSSMNPQTALRNTLRTMVETEARAMLEDPTIKRPSEDNILANTMWQAMEDEGNKEEGKASIDAWIEVAVHEIAKLPFVNIGDSIQAETKKALEVVMDGHYQYLSNKLTSQHEALKARIEG